MKSITMNLKGMDKLKKAIDLKKTDLIDGVDKEMNATVFDINRKQMSRTPVDTGLLRTGNVFDVTKKLEKQITNRIEYAPYIEFGTGGLVEIPAGLEEIAAQFKGQGKRKINMRAQPFFFAAFFEEKPKLMERIKKLLNK